MSDCRAPIAREPPCFMPHFLSAAWDFFYGHDAPYVRTANYANGLVVYFWPIRVLGGVPSTWGAPCGFEGR